MAVYNRERYTASAIESVLSQTRGDFELVICDDGSNDHSLQIARGYEKDSRIRIVSAKHKGYTTVLKKTIENTSGRYIGWIDSDDKLAPECLEKTAQVLNNNPNVGLVYTNYYEIDKHDKILGLGHRCQIPYSREGILYDLMTFHFRLIRRSTYLKAGGLNEFFKLNQDYDLCLRLSEITDVYHVPLPLYYYRRHKESVTALYRSEQIWYSEQAIKAALQRRGLTERANLEVDKTSGQVKLKLSPK